MFKIGEFSKLTQVSIRMLRYYDETGLLKPAKTDKFTHYRLYSTEQIPVLHKIIFLRDLGFTVSEIAEALEEWDNALIASLLDSKRLAILDLIRAEKEKLAKIELAKKDIQQENIETHYNVSIKSIPGYSVLALRRVVPDYYAEGPLWKELAAFMAKQKIAVSGNPFTIYHDTDYREKEIDIEICAPVTQTGKSMNGFIFRQTAPVPIMACAMVYGPFENIGKAYLSFANWLSRHPQYQMGGHSRQIVHRGQWNEDNPEKYLTEIQIPLENK